MRGVFDWIFGSPELPPEPSGWPWPVVDVERLARAMHAVDDDVQFCRRDARNFTVLAERIAAAYAAPGVGLVELLEKGKT